MINRDGHRCAAPRGHPVSTSTGTQSDHLVKKMRDPGLGRGRVLVWACLLRVFSEMRGLLLFTHAYTVPALQYQSLG